MEKILKISLKVWSTENIKECAFNIYEYQAKKTNNKDVWVGRVADTISNLCNILT